LYARARLSALWNMPKSHFTVQRMQFLLKLVVWPLKRSLQLIKVKCLPVLLYGLEACPLTKSDLQSLDFVINRFFMKFFTTKNIELVKYCQEYFGFAIPSVLWAKRVSKFESSVKCFLSDL